jgi:hypothetical protein
VTTLAERLKGSFTVERRSGARALCDSRISENADCFNT